MRKLVGISLKVRRAWLDALLARVVETTDAGELRAFLDQRLMPDLPGAQVRAKTAGILMRTWGTVPRDHVALRNRAVELIPRLSGDEVVWLHWGMASLAYPFLRDTAEVIGRILALQDDFSTPQVQSRLATAWGDRLTSRKSARYLLNTLVDWGVLGATKVKGRFEVASKLTSTNPDLQLWLLEALLRARPEGEVEVQQLLRLPESFPFAFSVAAADVRRHDRFIVHRQGLDMDMAALRHSAPATRGGVAKASKGRAAGAAVQQGLFDAEAGRG